MSAALLPEQCRVGIVGYGEVGRILAEDLRARGVARIGACDVKLGTAHDAPLREHGARIDVAFAASHASVRATSR